MGNVLAILDEEEEYVSRLLRYFNNKENRDFEAAAFTSEESLKHYGRKHEIGLLVCEETLYAALEEKPGCTALLLSGVKRVREGDGPPVIYKYQSAQEIFDEIVRYYREKMPSTARRTDEKNARILAVCSAVGGNGVSTLAYLLAKKKAKLGKTAFLSFDPFFLPERAQPDGSFALTEAIYFIRQDSAKISGKLKLKTLDRIDCLYGVAHWCDFSECGRQDAAKLLEGLLQTGQYEFVVIDTGAFTALSAGCMELADTVVLLESGKTEGKEQEFIRQVKCADADFERRLLRMARQPVEKMAEEVLGKIG